MAKNLETVVIVGAGIVGSALAHFLSAGPNERRIILVDRSLGQLLGSTGHAPGFVGQYNDSDVLSRLAMDTVSEYQKISGGFDNVGGLEIAFESSGIGRLHSRCAKAVTLGLPAEIVSIDRAHELAPELVSKSSSGTALHFPTDGTANADRITRAYRGTAKSRGVESVEGDVKKLLLSDGQVVGIELQDGSSPRELRADKVVLTTGIWAPDLPNDVGMRMPIVPVGHPYMRGQQRESKLRRMPFVRWPESHVYARDHGEHYGIGTYDHEPIRYCPTDETAIGHWVNTFNEPLAAAIRRLPEATGKEFETGERFNGIFSVTPDNLPLAGAFQSVRGLYAAAAVWVTHAAGTAKFVARLIDELEVDHDMGAALNPERFAGQDISKLQQKALSGYNEIYKSTTAGDS